MKKIYSFLFLGLFFGFFTGVSAISMAENFLDVPQGSYYAHSIHEMFERGVLKGYENGNFYPNEFLTRAQMAVVIDRYDQSLVLSDNEIGTLIDVVCNTAQLGDVDGSIFKRFENLCKKRGEARSLLDI